MSKAALPERGPAWARRSGAVLTALAVGWSLLLHHGVGPDLAGGDGGVLLPRGFLRDPLAAAGLDGIAAPLALLTLPALALALAVVLTTSSAVARWLSISAALFAAGCVFYGVVFPAPWKFFGWRWSATLVLFALAAGGSVSAVWLVQSWRRRGRVGRPLLYLPVCVGLVAFERGVTGTDATLPLALSPWPAVQVFGLETVATATAFLMGGTAVALWSFSGRAGASARIARAGAGLAAAPVLPAAALGLASSQGLLPFQARPGVLEIVAGTAWLLLAATSWGAWGDPRRLAERSRLFGLSALLLGAPLVGGQILTRLDYEQTRNESAQRLIEALDGYYEAEGIYPDRLEELVDTGRLEEVPLPRSGAAWLPTEPFVYQSFGTSYLLEFSAPRWIQCAYNPPYTDEELEEAEDGAPSGADGPAPVGDAGPLAGAWSCPATPPELW